MIHSLLVKSMSRLPGLPCWGRMMPNYSRHSPGIDIDRRLSPGKFKKSIAKGFTMTPRSVKHRAYPKNFVTHLRNLAATRSTDVALTVVGHEDERIADKTFDYATLDGHVRALAAILQGRFPIGERALLLMEND